MLLVKTKPDCTLLFVFNAGKEIRPLADLIEKHEIQGSAVINRLSEITEEQAKELVDLTIDDPQWREITESGNLKDSDHKYKLRNLASSVGIKEEEFSNYLVIRL